MASVQPFSYPSNEVLLCLCGPEVCFSLNSMFWGFPNGILSVLLVCFLVMGIEARNDLLCHHLDDVTPLLI